MRSGDAWDKAAECGAKIQTETDPRQREILTKMRDGWIELANEIVLIEGASLASKAKDDSMRVN